MKKLLFTSVLSTFIFANFFAQDVSVKEVPRQYNEPRTIEWSKDGKYYMITSFTKRDAETYSMVDGTTSIYSAAADTIVQARKYEAALCATFNPTNKEITTITYNNGIRKFNLGDTSSKVVTDIRHEEYPFRVLYSADGKDIMVGTVEGNILISDNATGKLKFKLEAVKDKIIISLHLVNGGKTLVSHSGGVIKYWDLAKGTLIKTVSAGEGEANEIACVNLSSDGKTLIAFAPGQILIYEAETGEIRTKSSTGSGYCCAVSNDGSLMAFGFSKGFYTFNGKGEVLRGMGCGDVRAMAFAPDGKSLIVALNEGQILKYLSAEIMVPSKE